MLLCALRYCSDTIRYTAIASGGTHGPTIRRPSTRSGPTLRQLPGIAHYDPAMRCTDRGLCCAICSTGDSVSSYAICGTGIAYAAMRYAIPEIAYAAMRYAIPGIAYAAMRYARCCAVLSSPPPRNPTQETTLSVQFVPGRRFLVFDFGVCAQAARTRRERGSH
eukprot:1416644-Rhodomonas_salina.3